ncbi:hypothetical protein PGC35_15685 [Psychrobacillus sp. PGGUH221]|uniref:hypothetical protein n=1 Tax=Psychrobacillus sp. PGGUH221 TaxID=3020058 RepID=UPI0035C69B17
MKNIIIIASSMLLIILFFSVLYSIDNNKQLQMEVESDLEHNFEVNNAKLDAKDLPENISVDFASNVYTILNQLNHHLGILPEKVLDEQKNILKKDKDDKRTNLEIVYYTENFIKYLDTIELEADTEQEIELKRSIMGLKDSSQLMAENILTNIKSKEMKEVVNSDFLKVQKDVMEVSTIIFDDGLTKYYIRIGKDSFGKDFDLSDSEPVSFLSKDSEGLYNPYLASHTVLKDDTLEGLINEPIYIPSTTITTTSPVKYEPSISMTDYEVIEDSTWGKPKSINRTETAYGVREQWVYDRGYLYFEDGYLTSIQSSR